MFVKYSLRITLILSLVLSAFLGCSKQNPGLLLQKYQAAYNSHNVDNIIDLLADSVIFKMDETILIEGKNDINNLIQYDSVLNTQLVFADIQIAGDTALFSLTEKNDWLEMTDIKEYPYGQGKIIFNRAGKIAFFRVDEDKTSADAFNGIFNSIVFWAEKDHKEEIDGLLETGYNAENAVRWLTLLKQWKAEQDSKE